jgi:hypothetical protein
MSEMAAQRKYSDNPLPYRGELERVLARLYRENIEDEFTRDDADAVAERMSLEISTVIGWPDNKAHRLLRGALRAGWDAHGPGPHLPASASATQTF